MREILHELDRWRAAGDRVARLPPSWQRAAPPHGPSARSSPSRKAGELAGSVSGGCVESEVVEAAREVLAGGEPRLLTFGISDDLALSVGLPCGGEIDVWVSGARSWAPRPPRRCRTWERRAVAFTDLADGTERLVPGGDDPVADDSDSRWSQQGGRAARQAGLRGRLGPPPRLLVYGAVDNCRRALRRGTRPRLAHDRRGCARTLRDPERLPNAHEVIVAWPDETLAQVQPDHATAVVVLTHDDKFDIPDARRHADNRRLLHRGTGLASQSGSGAASACSTRESTRSAPRPDFRPGRSRHPGLTRRPRRRSPCSRRSWQCGPPRRGRLRDRPAAFHAEVG